MSISRSLRRVVWLTPQECRIVHESAEKTQQDTDPYQYIDVSRILTEMGDTYNERYSAKHHNLAILTLTGLRMPTHLLPVTVTDDEINAMVVWGNLPDSLVKKMKPSPKIFVSPDMPLFYYDSVSPSTRIELSAQDYLLKKKQYRIRRTPAP